MDSSHDSTLIQILRSYNASFTPRETAPNEVSSIPSLLIITTDNFLQKRVIILSIILGAIFVFGVVAVLAAVALCLTEQGDDEEDVHRVVRIPGRFRRKKAGRGKARSKRKDSNQQDVEFQDLRPV
jgi:hypothetical protein